MQSYKYFTFSSIDTNNFKTILSNLINYLHKLKKNSIYQYISTFTLFLKYLDKNNLLFKNISQNIISNFIENLPRERKDAFKKVMVFLIKSGYLSRDDFNKYNTSKSKTDYYINEYLVYLKTSGRRDATCLKHKSNLERFFKFLKLKEKIFLRDVSRDILEEYMFELYNSKTKREGKKLTIATLIEYILSVKLYFRYLAKENIIIYDPAQFLKLPKCERKMTDNYFNQKELVIFFKTIKIKTISHYRIKVLFEIMYNIGLRINEVRHLKVDDINFETGIIHIKMGKGGYERSVPMSNYIQKYLKIYLKYGYKKNPENYLFFNSNNNKIFAKSYPIILLKKTVKEMGIKRKISFHVFRKSIGKHLLEKGLDIRYVQKFLGHRCINATQNYTVLNMNDLKLALEKYHPRELKKEEYIKKSKYRG